MISNYMAEINKRNLRISELEKQVSELKDRLAVVTEQRDRALMQADALFKTTDKLYEVYTDGNALFILTSVENVHKFIDGKKGWYSKEISFVDALIKYGNMALQSWKSWEASV